MDQLIALVAEKTGISPEKAKTSVETVLGFLKDRLPGPIASQVEAALSGSGGGLGDMAKGVTDLFGKKD